VSSFFLLHDADVRQARADGDRQGTMFAMVQNFGLRDGVPGTAYNKACKAVASIDDVILPLLRDAMANEDELVKQGTILGRLIKGMREEGADIMDKDLDTKAEYFSTECIGLVFAGVATSCSACASVSLFRASSLSLPQPHHSPRPNRSCSHSYVGGDVDS
jgi:hypothetical protein